jgi:hypothetical protein
VFAQREIVFGEGDAQRCVVSPYGHEREQGEAQDGEEARGLGVGWGGGVAGHCAIGCMRRGWRWMPRAPCLIEAHDV